MTESTQGRDHYRMYINGQWKDASSGKTIDVASPTTEEVLYTVPAGGTDDAQLALETAEAAQPAWAAMPAVERGAILSKFADLIRENRERLAKNLDSGNGQDLLARAG